MNKTPIEWVKNPDGSQGYTWNPITGCLNGCPYCYARKLANTRLKERYLANENVAEYGDWYFQHDNPFYPRFWEDRLEDVLHRRIDSPLRGIFACDMSDLFGIGIPEDWTRKVLGAIEANFYDRFYLLTKQPQNLIKFSPFPDNCWVGVSATNNYTYLGELQAIEAKVKYVSFEPLLNWRDFPAQKAQLHFILEKIGINWVIIGAQSKPTVYPKIEWVREIVQACDKTGIPVFLKDNLKPLYKTVMPNDDEIYLRQEMPRQGAK